MEVSSAARNRGSLGGSGRSTTSTIAGADARPFCGLRGCASVRKKYSTVGVKRRREYYGLANQALRAPMADSGSFRVSKEWTSLPRVGKVGCIEAKFRNSNARDITFNVLSHHVTWSLARSHYKAYVLRIPLRCDIPVSPFIYTKTLSTSRIRVFLYPS